MVQAKFRVEEKTDSNVILRPVTSGSEENETFWKYTPAGVIEMTIDNEQALDKFTVGKEYYVNFEEA